MYKIEHYHRLWFGMEIAVLLVIVGSLAAGVAGAVAATWRLRTSLLKLETEIDALAERTRGLIGRANGEKRIQKQQNLEEARQMVPAQAQARNPWDL